MNKSLFFFFIITFLNVSNVFAINRLESPINEMEKLLNKFSDNNNPARYLIRSKARVLAFQIQALGRLYKKEDKGLRKVRDSYKQFEDKIGELKKWIELLEFAESRGASKKKIKSLQDKVSKSEEKFNSFLLKKKWISGEVFKKHREYLTFLRDLSDTEERSLSLFLVKKSLEKVQTTDFDLSYLEEGNGLHEFRRELRWQVYQIVNLGGLIDYNSNRLSCPSLSSYDQATLSRSNKYTKVVKLYEEKSCLVDYCLINEIALMVSNFGDIKDEVEGLLNTTGENDDRTPGNFLIRAEKLKQSWDDKNVLPILIDQLNSCS